MSLVEKEPERDAKQYDVIILTLNGEPKVRKSDKTSRCVIKVQLLLSNKQKSCALFG